MSSRTTTRHTLRSPDIETTDHSGATVDRIVQAAYACFEKFGVKKTTIEDIATEAELARPTIYRYFAGKEDILRHICGLEIGKVNTELRSRISRRGGFDELLTECLLLTARIAHENNYVRMLVESPDVTSRGADPASKEYAANRAVWGSLLESGAQRNLLAKDLSLDDIASWLVLSESMLLVKIDSVSFTDDELRKFIRRFIVAPVLENGFGTSKTARKPARRRR